MNLSAGNDVPVSVFCSLGSLLEGLRDGRAPDEVAKVADGAQDHFLENG